MRALLSQLLTDSAKEDPRFMVLSGDHGYALFDQLRRERKNQFINVGVSEQAMVGLAAGLARQGFRPVVYGLAAFIPLRVLEQIKLDICFSHLPVVFLGDGAGLVYSTFGASHQCAEDLSCMRPMPFLRIFSPCDREELRACYSEACSYQGPSYIRLGKQDRTAVNDSSIGSTDPHWVWRPERLANKFFQSKLRICLVASGSMVSPAVSAAKHFELSCLSIPRIKPFANDIDHFIDHFDIVVILEEHSRYGGLASALMDALVEHEKRLPDIRVLSLEDKFSDLCGGYQYALSEHKLADVQVVERIRAFVDNISARLPSRSLINA
jgi:transketolase